MMRIRWQLNHYRVVACCAVAMAGLGCAPKQYFTDLNGEEVDAVSADVENDGWTVSLSSLGDIQIGGSTQVVVAVTGGGLAENADMGRAPEEGGASNGDAAAEAASVEEEEVEVALEIEGMNVAFKKEFMVFGQNPLLKPSSKISKAKKTLSLPLQANGRAEARLWVVGNYDAAEANADAKVRIRVTPNLKDATEQVLDIPFSSLNNMPQFELSRSGDRLLEQGETLSFNVSLKSYEDFFLSDEQKGVDKLNVKLRLSGEGRSNFEIKVDGELQAGGTARLEFSTADEVKTIEITNVDATEDTPLEVYLAQPHPRFFSTKEQILSVSGSENPLVETLSATDRKALENMTMKVVWVANNDAVKKLWGNWDLESKIRSMVSEFVADTSINLCSYVMAADITATPSSKYRDQGIRRVGRSACSGSGQSNADTLVSDLQFGMVSGRTPKPWTAFENFLDMSNEANAYDEAGQFGFNESDPWTFLEDADVRMVIFLDKGDLNKSFSHFHYFDWAKGRQGSQSGLEAGVAAHRYFSEWFGAKFAPGGEFHGKGVEGVVMKAVVKQGAKSSDGWQRLVDLQKGQMPGEYRSLGVQELWDNPLGQYSSLADIRDEPGAILDDSVLNSVRGVTKELQTKVTLSQDPTQAHRVEVLLMQGDTLVHTFGASDYTVEDGKLTFTEAAIATHFLNRGDGFEVVVNFYTLQEAT